MAVADGAGAEAPEATRDGDSACSDGGALVSVAGACAAAEVFVSGTAAGEAGVSFDTTAAGVFRDPRKCQPAAIATTTTTPTVANKGTRDEPCLSSRSTLAGCADSTFGARVP